MADVIVLNNAVVKTELTILRNKETTTPEFRGALKRIGYALAVESSNFIEVKELETETPLEVTVGFDYQREKVIIPILRAGLGFLEPFLDIFPRAKVGHIGLKRDEETLQPREYYYNSPGSLEDYDVVVVDPMLATGGSAVAAVDNLKKRGAKRIMFVCLIAAPEGIEQLAKAHGDVRIITAAMDRELNEKGYILPGLGDAGDRSFGTV